MKVKKVFYVCEGVEYSPDEVDKYIRKKGLEPDTPEAAQLVATNCKVIKRKVKLGVVEAILYIIAIIIAVVIAVALFIVLIPAIEALLTVVIPTIAKSLKVLGEWVYNRILPETGLLRKGLDALKNMYDKWVEPTLRKVESISTHLRDMVYRTYTATIGGITETYNNLFGWVDGLQNQLNRAFTTVGAVVSIVDERAGKKIAAKAEEINRFIDSVTSDLFDKLIHKINEVASPILKRVDEVNALLTSKIDVIRETVDSVNKTVSTAFVKPTQLSDEVVIDTATTEAHTFQRKSAGGEGLYTPDPIVQHLKESVEEKWFDDILRIMKQEKPSRYDMIKKGIQRCIDIIAGREPSWEYHVDEEVDAFAGDVTAGDLEALSKHAEMWDAGDEPGPDWINFIKYFVKLKQKRQIELSSMMDNENKVIEAYLNNEISEVELVQYLKKKGYKKKTIDDLLDMIGWSGSVGKIE